MSITSAQAEQLVNAYAREGGAAVIDSMLKGASSGEMGDEKRVEEVMDSLEQMAEQHPETACCLMLFLWPIADRLLMHHICDGVDLWIHHNRSESIVEQLKSLVASSQVPGLKRHFEKLLAVGGISR